MAKFLDRVIFIQIDTVEHIQRIGLQRVHFAFVDATHDKISVMKEFEYIQLRQKRHDMIMFDDVSASFSGVIDALDTIDRVPLQNHKIYGGPPKGLCIGDTNIMVC